MHTQTASIVNFQSIMVYGFGMHLPHRIPNAVYALRTYLHFSCLLNAMLFRDCLIHPANLLRVQRATTDVLTAVLLRCTILAIVMQFFLFTTEPLSSLSPDGVFEGLERHCTASIGGFGVCDAVFLFTTEPLSSLSPDGVF
jgi:hypothetical protein